MTNSQFAVFMSEGGYSNREFWSEEGRRWIRSEDITAPAYWRNPEFNAPNQPVVGVSWWEAEAFCEWAGGFLPAEQQWEAAARGSEGLAYPWGNDWENGICNSSEAGLGGTSAVGIFPRDVCPFGVMDMAGNVIEWCEDGDAPYRVLRGGSWRSFSTGSVPSRKNLVYRRAHNATGRRWGVCGAGWRPRGGGWVFTCTGPAHALKR